VITAPFASTDSPCRDELALFVARDEVVERIAFELLDPSEIRSRSTSIDSTCASVSSPFLKLRTASSPGSDQDRSERCTRPSIPP